MRFPYRELAAFAWVALLFSQCGAQEPGSRAGQGAAIGEIQSLIRSKQYDKALALTSARLKNAPSDYRLWTIQGIALSLRGDGTHAVDSFQEAIRLSPSYTPALKGEAQILFQSGDKRAIPVLERIVKADPNDATAHEMLAYLERKEEHCAAANDHFALAADAINAHPESLAAYGYCLFETKQPEKAAPVFERLVEVLPDRPYIRYDLAVVQVAAKQYDAAVTTLHPLLTSDQKAADVFSLASQAYEKLKNTPKAVELLRQAIVLSPKTPGYYAAFAALCLEHDSFQTGVDMMNVGLKNVPNDPSLYLSRGLLYVELADFANAEADFLRVEKLSSFQALGSYALDLTEVQRNNPEQALARVRSQLSDRPDDPLLNYFLAQSLMNQSPDKQSDAYKEAMSAALKAVAIKPDYVPVHDLLASLYLQANQYAKAIEECHTALLYDPSDEGATYHLLIALKHTGQMGEIAGLSRRLAQLHRESLQHENERKSFRLIKADPASNQNRTGADSPAR